ncbi:MAG: tetratricopeptide repeat protein [Nitrospirae bacterium]|nr:tetratricopeptide repeat protein [Nitrospirota bacterium]
MPFQFDDKLNIVENSRLRSLENYWSPVSPRWFGYLTFALNYHFNGLDTYGYHIVNIFIHILNGIFVYLLISYTFETPAMKRLGSNNPQFKNAIPLFAALLFVSHPIQTQAVTYIVQRFTSLATFFYLLSLVTYIKFRIQPSAISRLRRLAEESGQQKLYATRYTLYAGSLLSAILAMGTKEISFTLPVAITIYELMFFEGNLRKRFLHLLPLLIIITIIPLSLTGADKPKEDLIGTFMDASRETTRPRLDYLYTEFRVTVTYIRLLILPINQNLDYDYPLYHTFFNHNVCLSFLFLLSLIVLAAYLLCRSPHASGTKRLTAFGTFWFFTALSVESSIIPIEDVIFEHRVYLPSVGAFIALSTSLFAIQYKFKKKWTNISFISALIIIICSLSAAAYSRNFIWGDSLTLWNDVVSKSPLKARGYFNRGNAYVEKEKYNDAIEDYNRAIALNNRFTDAYFNRGVAYFLTGLYDKAIEDYSMAINLRTANTNAHFHRGIAYGRKGEHDKAIEDYSMVISLNPGNSDAYTNRGISYSIIGQTDKANADIKMGLETRK